jgi:hypothetical protein
MSFFPFRLFKRKAFSVYVQIHRTGDRTRAPSRIADKPSVSENLEISERSSPFLFLASTPVPFPSSPFVPSLSLPSFLFLARLYPKMFAISSRSPLALSKFSPVGQRSLATNAIANPKTSSRERLLILGSGWGGFTCVRQLLLSFSMCLGEKGGRREGAKDEAEGR